MFAVFLPLQGAENGALLLRKRLCTLMLCRCHCRDLKKRPTPPFEIPVPPGTVVKRKSNGLLLGDLTNKGGGGLAEATAGLSASCGPFCLGQLRVCRHMTNCKGGKGRLAWGVWM